MFAATPTGFKNAPVSKFVIGFIVGSSIVSSIVGVKHYFFLQLVPHIWGWGQWWRLFIWEFVYLNNSEVLFSSLLLYNLRVIERLLGSRKFASMLIISYAFTFVLSPLLLVCLKIVPGYSANYLPPGPTSAIFSVLALYHELIPSVYKFRISSSSQPEAATPSASPFSQTLTLSDKIFVYVLSVQLAVSQPPGSLICAFTGWLIGVLWTREVLPGRNWRIPEWLWERTRSSSRGFAAFGTGPSPVAVVPGMPAANNAPAEGANTGAPAANTGRGFGSQLLDTFRGSF